MEDYKKIYGDMSNSKSIALILKYNSSSKQKSTIKLNSKSFEAKKGVIGIIGAGNFTSSTILPILKNVMQMLNILPVLLVVYLQQSWQRNTI